MPIELVLITGLSGSGKSTVAKCFEDLGYHCVDNLPLPLLRELVSDPLQHLGAADARLAVVTDVRAPGFASQFPRIIDAVDRERVRPTLLFLESSDESLVRRFSETRRPHPLAGDGPAIEGIRRERELLQELRGRADLVFDTSEWSIHEIRGHVFREFSGAAAAEAGLVVSLVSFGFKFGIPYGTDLLFDVRFLPNPHFVPGLREKTGLDPDVVAYLDAEPEFHELLRRLEDLLLYLLPRYRAERRSYLSVAVGCTGGKHRSVGACERLAQQLRAGGWEARVIHRDISR
jgi:UPF0042 nucleotide-binding protein